MKTLNFTIPDLPAKGLPFPFVLWDVVDQPLLHHWLDHAVDHKAEKVRIYCPPRLRPAMAVAMENVQLWPLDIQLAEGRIEDSALLNRLPEQTPEEVPNLLELRDLLDWHASLTRVRLQNIWTEYLPEFPFLTRGTGSYVHPDAVLEGPYWIGDGAQIEAGAYIGAFSVVGSGARVRKGAAIKDSHLFAGTDLKRGIRLDGHSVIPGLIYNHRSGLLQEEPDRGIVQFRARALS